MIPKQVWYLRYWLQSSHFDFAYILGNSICKKPGGLGKEDWPWCPLPHGESSGLLSEYLCPQWGGYTPANRTAASSEHRREGRHSSGLRNGKPVKKNSQLFRIRHLILTATLWGHHYHPTVSPLHTSLQVVNFQRCKRVCLSNHIS